MSSLGILYRDINELLPERVPTWKLLIWINEAIKAIIKRTDCLWDYNTIEGLRRIEILNSAAIDANDNTVTITIDGTDTVLTEDTDWQAGGSNTACATNLAAAITALTGVSAYADGVYVYVCGVDTTTSIASNADTSDLTISDDGYEVFDLDSILTRFRKVDNIFDIGNEIQYRSLTADQYARTELDSNFDGSVYHVSSDHKMKLQKEGANISSASEIRIEYFQWAESLSAATDTPPGILDDFDEVIKNRVVRRFHEPRRHENPQQAAILLGTLDIEYEASIRAIKRHIRDQGKLGIGQFLYEWK